MTKLRTAYQRIAHPEPASFNPAALRQALADARAVTLLTAREREELQLIDAKIDIRAGSAQDTGPLASARKKLTEFSRTARSPDYRSEARGWLAYIHFLLGEQTSAVKIYLDELNRAGSSLSQETVLNSLRLTYGADGGPELLKHLEEYFDTARHAAFAIQLVTNPRDQMRGEQLSSSAYQQVTKILERHRSLVRSEVGANSLAMLGMRTALRAGDPSAALRIAAEVPVDAAIRNDPEFYWMVASAYFLSHNFAAAEAPLLRIFRSRRSSEKQKSAAAYALCGVYQKRKNPVEQMRFALWIYEEPQSEAYRDRFNKGQGMTDDDVVYWVGSPMDLELLLDSEASIEALQSFLTWYPNVPDTRLVKYSIAVRPARENRYDAAAAIYQALDVPLRTARMRQLAVLYREANRTDRPRQELLEAKYKMAEFIAANQEQLYFNDQLWAGQQQFALGAASGADDGGWNSIEREHSQRSGFSLDAGVNSVSFAQVRRGGRSTAAVIPIPWRVG